MKEGRINYKTRLYPVERWSFDLTTGGGVL